MQRLLAGLGRRGVSGPAARLLAVLLLVAFVVAAGRPAPALGQDDDEEGTAEASAEEATEPLGTFTVAITEADLPPALPGGPGLIGVWNISFNEDGSYEVARQDVGTLVTGTYEVEGDTLSLTDEGGLLSCGNAEVGGAAEASYAWEVAEGELSLTPIDDGCAGRRILLTTRTLGGYAPCEVEPLRGVERGQADDDDDGGPPPDLGGIFGDQTPAADDDAGVDQPASAETEAAIDELLSQATACWMTGDPALFLALHSENALDDLALLGEGAGGLQSVAEILGGLMTQPVSFERIGAVQQLDPTHVRARVAIGTGGSDGFFQAQDFVLEDGEWLFDSFFLLTTAEEPS